MISLLLAYHIYSPAQCQHLRKIIAEAMNETCSTKECIAVLCGDAIEEGDPSKLYWLCRKESRKCK